MLHDMLKLEGFAVGRKYVRTLMDKMSEANHQLASYLGFYNTGHSNSSLGGQTPDIAYCGNGERKKAG